MENAELIKALRCKECFDLCNVESCRYHLTNTKSGCRCAIKLMATAAADRLEAADKRVKELDAAQRWIPCAERLPEYDPSKGANAYWIAKKTRNGEWQMKIALYSDYGYAASVDIASNVTWRDYDFCQIMNVTHWQPLPQPPQKGE